MWWLLLPVLLQPGERETPSLVSSRPTYLSHPGGQLLSPRRQAAIHPRFILVYHNHNRDPNSPTESRATPTVTPRCSPTSSVNSHNSSMGFSGFSLVEIQFPACADTAAHAASRLRRRDSAERQRASNKLYFWFITLIAFIYCATHFMFHVAVVLIAITVVRLERRQVFVSLWWIRQAFKAFVTLRHCLGLEALCALRRSEMISATSSSSGGMLLWLLFTKGLVEPILVVAYGRLLHCEVTEMLLVISLATYTDLCALGLWRQPPLAMTVTSASTHHAGSSLSPIVFPWALALIVLGRLAVFKGYKHFKDQDADQEAQSEKDRMYNYNYTKLHYTIGCVLLALVVLQIIQLMAALGATDDILYDIPWLSIATATLTCGAAAAVVTSPIYKLSSISTSNTAFALWYALLTSALGIVATTARAHTLLLTWDEVAASVIPQCVSLAVAVVGVLLSKSGQRSGQRRSGGGSCRWAAFNIPIRGAMLVAFPCGVALQCAYSMFTTGGDPTIVSDIHLLAHAAGYVDLVCATAICNWTVAVLSGASLARTGAQLLFSISFFLVISLGHASQFLIMITASLHLLLLTLRMVMANRRSVFGGMMTTAVRFDDDVNTTGIMMSVADAAKFV